MNKQQRLKAAQAALNKVGEGDPGCVCREIANEFGLAYAEVDAMYWRPLIEAYYTNRSRRGGYCHYCGLRATHWNMFDVQVCADCG